LESCPVTAWITYSGLSGLEQLRFDRVALVVEREAGKAGRDRQAAVYFSAGLVGS
jgi:hypothetical protein